MKLIAVRSSHIEAIGYEAGTMEVHFAGGKVITYENVDAHAHAALMAAESKGSHLHQYFHAKGNAARPMELNVYDAELRILETFDADPCCSRRLSQAIAGGFTREVETWTCTKCSTEWKARMVGPVKHWEPAPLIMIF